MERIEHNMFAGGSRLHIDDRVGGGNWCLISNRLSRSRAWSRCDLSRLTGPELGDQRTALLGAAHCAAVLGNLLMRKLLSEKYLVIVTEKGGWTELPLGLANVEAEADDDDHKDDENEAEDPHEEDLGSVAPVPDGGSPLSLKPDPDRS